MGCWIMAGVTFREAARKKILYAALIAGMGLIGLFAAALHFQIADFARGTLAPFIRYQILSAMLMIGLYTVDLLAVVMTILASVDTVSGEIVSGTIQAMAMKPVARWQLLMGKWLGFAGMIAVYVVLTFGGVIAVGYWMGGVAPRNALFGGLLIYLECLLALTLTFAFGTSLSTLTSGVIVLGLQGLALMAGWLEQISGFTESSRLVTIGVLASLVMPGESLWRRAAFEMQTPLAGSLQFSPFADVSVPSAAMVGYAGIYLLIALTLAIHHFGERDL